MATYAELIDDFELEKRIRTIPEDMDLSEYIKQRGGVDYSEEKADGGTIGIEVLFEKEKRWTSWIQHGWSSVYIRW